MAVRQKSELTGKPRSPRIQAVISESLLEKLEAYAKARELSVSRAVDEILRRFFDDRPSVKASRISEEDGTPSNPDDIVHMFKMFKKMQEAGLI